MARERRSNQRVEVSRPLLYRTDIYPRPRLALIVDLSMGGVAVDTPYSLRMGERLEMTIGIPPRLIKCRGKVVHVLKLVGKRLKAGVRFEGLSGQDKMYLRQHVSSVTETQGGEKPLTGFMIGLGIGLLGSAAIVYLILSLL